MSTCNTPTPADATEMEKARWAEGVRIISEALADLECLGLRIHTAYHEDFFMEFTKRENK